MSKSKPAPRAKAPKPRASSSSSSARPRRSPAKASPAAKPTRPPASAPTSRTGALRALLARPEGAALTELVEATGWQTHSVRAALTHLRRAGHTVERRTTDEGGARYHLTLA